MGSCSLSFPFGLTRQEMYYLLLDETMPAAAPTEFSLNMRELVLEMGNEAIVELPLFSPKELKELQHWLKPHGNVGRWVAYIRYLMNLATSSSYSIEEILDNC